MSSAIDQAFSAYGTAMKVYSRRAEVLSTNMANADTPHFKARDLDFRAILQQSQDQQPGLRQTHPGHISLGDSLSTSDALKYRVPVQPSADGNTVDSEVEQSRFAENTIYYQASLSFMGGTIKGLMAAIKGE